MRKLGLILITIAGILNASTPELTLDECLQLAAEKNPELRLANLQAQSALQGVKASYQSILPMISLRSAATHSTQGPSEYVFNNMTFERGDTSTNYFNTALSYQQNLYDGGKWWNTIKYARGNLASAQMEVQGARQQIVANVTEKFYQVLKAQELLKVYEVSLKNSQEQLKKTEELLRIGQVAKKDLFKAQVQEGNSRLAVIRQTAEVDKSLSALKVAIGVNPDFELSIREISYQKPAVPELKAAQSKALESNTTLRKLSLDKDNSYLNYKIARGDLLPSVSSSFSYARGGSEFARTVSQFDKWWNTNLSLNISYPLFEGYYRKANIQQKMIAYRAYDDRILSQKMGIFNQIEILIRTINTYNEMISVNELNLVSAEEDLRLAQEMYRLSSATLLEVLDAQVNLTRAQGDLVATKYDAKIAEVQLALLMGTL